MIPVLTPDEMAAVDAAAPEPTDVLIDRAGAAVARTAMALMGGGAYGRRVHVIAGKGNNGGDGRRAAALLAAAGAQRRGARCGELPARAGQGRPRHRCRLRHRLPRRVGAPDTDAAAVLAVDIPSGVDGMTGVVSGRALQADVTVTFAAMKPGHLFGDGRALSGRVDVADIGLPLDRHGRSQRTGVVDEDDIASWWQPRPHEAHKWSSALRVVAGSPGMGERHGSRQRQRPAPEQDSCT
ncbi:MAG: NAD(P)H-hydrate epimerase [Ilumatobacteraceae bacterium]